MIVPFTGAPRSPSTRPSDENLLMAAAVMHEQGRLVLPSVEPQRGLPIPRTPKLPDTDPNLGSNA